MPVFARTRCTRGTWTTPATRTMRGWRRWRTTSTTMLATQWGSSLWRQGTTPLRSGGPTLARSCACTRATLICYKRWPNVSAHTGDDDQRLPGAAHTTLLRHVLYLASIFLCTILEAGLVSTVPCMRLFCILFAHALAKRGCRTKPRASSFDSVVETMLAFTTPKG
ncbi:unnamed protein product [Ixodes pacificus]